MAKTTIEGDLLELPLREDGTQYQFAMLLPDETVLADTRTELVGSLIDAYEDIPEGADGDEEALVARHEFACLIAHLQQQHVLGEAALEGRFDPSVESEDTLTAFLSPRTEPIRDVKEWKHELPLVLVALHYAPYTQENAPTGNVKFIDPYTETTLLDTLGGLGVLEVLAHED